MSYFMTEYEIEVKTKRLAARIEQMNEEEEKRLLEQYVNYLGMCGKEDSQYLPCSIYLGYDENKVWLDIATGLSAHRTQPENTKALVVKILKPTEVDDSQSYEAQCNNLMEYELALPFTPEYYGYPFHILEDVRFRRF